MKTLNQLKTTLNNYTSNLDSQIRNLLANEPKNSWVTTTVCINGDEINKLCNEIQDYETQAQNSYNSAVSSYNSNVQYYTNQDKTTYDSNALNVTNLTNSLRGKTEDVQQCLSTIQNKNTLLTQKITAKNKLLNDLTPEKLSHTLLKSIEGNNVVIQDLIKVKNFDPSYKMKGGAKKYLLEIEITHNKKALFDLTIAKHPELTQEAKNYLINIANNNQNYVNQLSCIIPIDLQDDDKMSVDTEYANQGLDDLNLGGEHYDNMDNNIHI